MLDSSKQGHGILIISDGSFDYYGNFVADRKEGKGVKIKGPDKKVAWVGTWENDKLNGEVLIVNLPECKEVTKAIFKNDRKVAEVD